MKKNNRIHIYYVLLGIGIGLVLGSIINIISPNVIVRDYTDDEIIQRARELGMLSLDEIIQKNEEINDNNKQKAEKNELSIPASETKEDIKDDANETETVEYIEFEVNKGDSSEKVIDNLFEANIIDDKEEFIKAIIKREAGRKIHFGKFKIPKGADYNTIIDILTK